ncbi:hypothetical protein B0T18DRAFT_409724 [Schizothecium vesticola]|uniref:Uncharacterized protein n=1 Tax=Schizothecium vesticola TaxID=314040 RepID=A0AA40EU79_9PEZI|nr:hypothetical protein B0T18DRAFT_409724 [Schizothecium vesticola]
MANATCPPGNSLPVFNGLPIPANITTAFTPRNNDSEPAMIACCSPNPVNVAADCYVWCEVPPRLQNGSQVEIQGAFSNCLHLNSPENSTQIRIVGAHVAMAARAIPTTRELGLWALLSVGGWVLALGM